MGQQNRGTGEGVLGGDQVTRLEFTKVILTRSIFGLAMVVRFDMLDFLAVAVEMAGPGDFVVPADIQEAVVVEIYLELLAPE